MSTNNLLNPKNDDQPETQSTGYSNPLTRGCITPFLVIISGILVFFISSWNSTQAGILLNWAAEREGKALFNKVVHESEISPGRIFMNPELLYNQISSDSSIVAAGLIQGQTVIASFTKDSSKDFIIPDFETNDFSKILDSELSLYVKSSGPGNGNGWQRRRGGGGPPWLRSTVPQDDSSAQRMGIYLIFKGPDKSIVTPLIYQKYLWPAVWVLLSVLWGSVLLHHSRMARFKEHMQKESHLASVGKMSARLAHEIRNPLGAVRGMAQLLSKKIQDRPELIPMTSTIEKETFRLEELTKSILDFSKPAECQLANTNISYIIKDTVNFFINQDKRCKIEMQLPEEDVYCSCDENATRQILLNILKNAVDATIDNEHAIKIALTSTDNHKIKIKVFNRSEPLSPNLLENVFEPFISTKTRGYGLGLPISKKLAELQNGKLSLKNFDKQTIMAELVLNKETLNDKTS